MGPFIILGCGYTGRRVARRLLDAGFRVAATARSLEPLRELIELGLQAHKFDAGNPESLASVVSDGSSVLHSIPTLVGDDGPYEATADIVSVLGDRPRRFVYLSTTGVYGPTSIVNETTPINPRTQRTRLRAAAEQAVASGPWESLILRPAAIYGPGRGVQVALPAGKYRLLGDGSNYVSRIHVDDLAAITAAALMSDLTGAYPVADDHACTSVEIAEWVGRLLDAPVITGEAPETLSETRRPGRQVDGRQVDGRAIRRLLNVTLEYPSYHSGIPASLA